MEQQIRNRSVFNAQVVYIEIQAGEGGEDAKLFVHDLFAAYVKWAERNQLKIELVDSIHGKVSATVSGKRCGYIFLQEAGQHCIQRIPPTEKKSKRQTSYVIVTVLPVPPIKKLKLLRDDDVEISFQVGSGPGGQHRNRTASCVRMKHKATGIEVYIDGRKQHQNRKMAKEILSARVSDYYLDKEQHSYDHFRKEQVGMRSRGNKIRTYNLIKSRAVDHRTNKKTSKVKEVIEKGRFDLLT